MLGITTDGSVSLGRELAGGGAPILRFAVGGSYQVQRAGDDPGYFHYLAFEPWLVAGVTLGGAVTDAGDAKFMYGIWEGWANDLGDSLLDGSHSFIDDDTRFHWVFSLSVGWRGVGAGTHQFYITPKVWRIKGWDFFT